MFEFKTIGGLRLVWFWDAHRVILCSHGFVKKRQDTPLRELKTGSDWKKEYELAKKTKELEIIEDP